MTSSAPRHLPSIDGIRAWAILLVILGHLQHTTNAPFTISEHAVGDLGNLGVRIFFVVSGFLITHLLLREEIRTGRVSLRHFYLRRVLRIFPAFYAFLAAMVIAAAAGWIALPGRDLAAAATYTSNFLRGRTWYTGHSWSLAVEEQFYLLWPGLFLLTGRRGRLTTVAIAVAAAPLVRIAVWIWLPAWRLSIGEIFPTVMDAIGTGALLALLRTRLHAEPRYRRWLDAPTSWLAPVVVVGIFAVNAFDATWFRPGWLLGNTVLDALIAFGVDRAIAHPDDAAGQVLNWRAMAVIGVLSYSLYLWQQPFLARGGRFIVQRFPWNLGCIAAAAVVSYYVIERPALRLKRRFGGVRSAVPDLLQP